MGAGESDSSVPILLSIRVGLGRFGEEAMGGRERYREKNGDRRMDFLNPDGSAHSSVPILLSIRVGFPRGQVRFPRGRVARLSPDHREVSMTHHHAHFRDTAKGSILKIEAIFRFGAPSRTAFGRKHEI
jgi:hypothetical protein